MVTHMRWHAIVGFGSALVGENVDRDFRSTGPGRRGSVAFYPLNTQLVEALRLGDSATHRFIWAMSSGKRSIISSDIAHLQRKKEERGGSNLRRIRKNLYEKFALDALYRADPRVRRLANK